MITGDDTRDYGQKKNLQKQFKTKDLGSLKYFLGIEMVRSKKSILLSKKVHTRLAFGDCDARMQEY